MRTCLCCLQTTPWCLQVALPVASKKGNAPLTVPPSEGYGSLPAKAEANLCADATAALSASPQQTIPAGAPQHSSGVTLPAAPVMLDSRHGSTASMLHPLPSVPITGTADLGSATPSLGAWSPHQPRQSVPAQTAAPAAKTSIPVATVDVPPSSFSTATERSEGGMWADLAAELKSAPISMPHLAEPDSILFRASDAVPSAAAASTSASAPVHVSSTAGHDQPPSALLKSPKKAQPSRTRKKLIAKSTAAPPQGLTEPLQDDRPQPDLELGNDPSHDDLMRTKPKAAKIPRARGKGAAAKAAADSEAQDDPASAASQNTTSKASASADVTDVTEAQQAVVAPDARAKPQRQVAKGPADRTKKGNFRGTGAICKED